jgi:four helix bundle protein
MAYRSYEELGVWQRGLELAVQIYRVMSSCQDFGLRNQLCRAAVSIPSNIAEGVERESKKESVHFLHIAKGSCAELRTQLLIGNKVGLIPSDEYIKLNTEATEISRMLHGLIKSIKT